MYTVSSSKFFKSEIGLRHKHSLSYLFTVSRLLALRAHSCGHCLDMPVENRCLLADRLHRTLWETPGVQNLPSFTPSTVRKSTGRGCDRYPSVNGTLVETEPWFRWGPGNRGWTPVVLSRLFPLPDAVARLLGCHPSALAVSLRCP